MLWYCFCKQYEKHRNRCIIHYENIKLMKKIIGLGVVTGVVIFAYLQSFNNKLNKKLVEGPKENAQLV